MEINIENIGIIKKADININGLTVICGENDTGKSTIGKSLFALVKGIVGFDEEFQEDFSYELFNNFRQIQRLMSRMIDINILNNDLKKNNILLEYYTPRNIRNITNSRDGDYFKDLKNVINSLYTSKKLDDTTYNEFIFYFQQHEEIIKQNSDIKTKQKRALEKAFLSEFQSFITEESIVNLKNLNDNLTIQFDKKCKIKNDIKNFEFCTFRDITYIETPAIIQFFRLILSARVNFSESRRVQETVPLHTKDLTRKLFNSDPFKIPEEFESINKMISEAISGQFYYSKDQKDFILERDKKSIPSMDVASGIKSLGIIDILIRNNILNIGDIIIIDEPEINLHPEWQNLYAEVICQLVNYGITAVVVTHSPYMVSALYVHSDRILKKKSSFYLSEKKEDGVYFSDESNNVMGGIVKKFALALEGLYL